MDTIRTLKETIVAKERECESKLKDFHTDLQDIIEVIIFI